MALSSRLPGYPSESTTPPSVSTAETDDGYVRQHASTGGSLVQRRRFLIRLSQALASLGALPVVAKARLRAEKTTPIHLQDCRIAGSHHYDCSHVLADLRPGDALQFRRQPGNPHDERAIEIFWRDRKLGYLPRLENAAAASLLDRAHELRGEILAVDDPDEEWEPISLRVWIHARPGDAR